jgi:blue light- and temperature-responsive anti-repressor
MPHRIIYCSRSIIAGSPSQKEAALEAILRASRSTNRKCGVTGALLFNGEAFAQVLEGSRSAVESIYAKICEDPRHSQILLLESARAADRDFRNWTMAYAKTDRRSNGFEGLRFEQSELNPTGVAHHVLQLLKAIVESYASS